jgi:NADH:ubiquinone reductase (H+-translocating)
MARPRVVIVGAGFGGLEVAKRLRGSAAFVTVLDRQNHHLFQPLLYQVATAGLSPADIAVPIRSVLRGQRHMEVFLAQVVGIDLEAKAVQIEAGAPVPYDILVLATGARHSYFGRTDWENLAPGLKTIDEAVCIRRDILLSFELAERATDPAVQQEHLTFVVVGAGATGVEMAGSIAELAKRVLVRDFDHIRSADARVVLVEAGKRVLSGLHEVSSARALRDLRELGVEVRLETMVTSVDERGVDTSEGRIDARTVIWAAGVEASPAARWLGVEPDRAGQVRVGPDLTVPDFPDVYAIGDVARFEQEGQPLPGVAPVAVQQGKYVARAIGARLAGRSIPPFRYRDKGMLATIGRRKAVAEFRGARFGGRLAWLLWLFVHIMYLVGFKNKATVLIQWSWNYFTWQRGARIITKCSD